MLRSILRWGAFCGLTACVALPALAKKPETPKRGGEAISVTAISFDFEDGKENKRKFGKLVWRGGLVLTSNSPFFGGLSGLSVTGRGRKLFAVTDSGSWLTADLIYHGRQPKKLDHVRIGPLLARNGRKLGKKKLADAEALDMLPDRNGQGQALISFERVHRIGVFPLDGRGFGVPTRYLHLPRRILKSEDNKGLEATAYLRRGALAGTVITFAERNLDKKGNLRGWLLGGKRPGELTLKRRKGFNITDAKELPDGDLLILERRFKLSEGVKMRLRRIAQSDIRPGALLDGEILLEANQAYNIDNMEGLAVHISPAGDTVITLISDDNFSFLQRTLLMQFTLPAKRRQAAN